MRGAICTHYILILIVYLKFFDSDFKYCFICSLSCGSKSIKLTSLYYFVAKLSTTSFKWKFAHPFSLFPFLTLPPPSMSENSQIPPYFISYSSLSPPQLVTYNRSPSPKNSQSSQTFPSMSQNTSSMFRKPPNSSIRSQTPSNEEVDT